ncbi:MAG: outer membrane lipoprotein-sorting protein [Spirochaetae bacterium HGW-Spirochaetae-5]|nr:MAG: outer membrane lipoprotein-sorting protein [Spirochaetae bacterium HGW-Spirochaetae-5]
MRVNRRFIVYFKIITMSILLIFPGVRAYAVDAAEIIKKSEEAVRGDTQTAFLQIIIKTRRWTRTLEMKSWENRLQKKSFSEITSPEKDAGNRFLLIDQEMRQYNPRLKKDIKISPSMMLQSWMGSDFTNDDIIKESSITKDYFHTLDGDETIDGHQCYRVILKPKPEAAVVWGRIVYYARKSDYLPVLEEFYNEHGVKKKIMTCGGFKTMHDRVIPTTYKMQTVGKDDRYTMMNILYVKFNEQIPPSVFTLQNLKRR